MYKDSKRTKNYVGELHCIDNTINCQPRICFLSKRFFYLLLRQNQDVIPCNDTHMFNVRQHYEKHTYLDLQLYYLSLKLHLEWTLECIAMLMHWTIIWIIHVASFAKDSMFANNGVSWLGLVLETHYCESRPRSLGHKPIVLRRWRLQRQLL